MIKIGICEDVSHELIQLKEIVEGVMAQLSVNYIVYGYRSGEDILLELEQTGNMEIIFLDIQMQGINGIETARKIRLLDTKVLLIFVSSYDQYCKELIETQPFAFIDKPIDRKKFKEILSHAVKIKLAGDENFYYSAHRAQYSLPISLIRFFQSDRRTIHINTSNPRDLNTDIVFYGKLEDVEKEVNRTSAKFLRIQKSFLINTKYIKEYAANKVVLDNGFALEIGKNYKETVRKHYMETLRERKWV